MPTPMKYKPPVLNCFKHFTEQNNDINRLKLQSQNFLFKHELVNEIMISYNTVQNKYIHQKLLWIFFCKHIRFML